MGKFETYFIKNIIEEWKKDYFDFKGIKEFIDNSRIDIMSSDENKEKDLTYDKDIRLDSPGSSMDSRPGIIKNNCLNKDYLNNFNSLLDSEIKKIYLFFINRERELYISINSHLHIRQSFDSFDTYNIIKEFEELWKISVTALNLSIFINQNMSALRIILNKFDKHFNQYYNNTTLKYIDRKIKAKNSDLLYILQFKIIDEVSAILEDITNELKHIAIERPESLKKDTLLIDQKNYKKEIKSYISWLDKNLFEIDEMNAEFRRSFKEWTCILKEQSTTYNIVSSITRKTSLGGISYNINEIDKNDISYDKISHNNRRTMSIDSSLYFSKQNLHNINISLFYTFFYMLSFSIILPTNIFYVNYMNHEMNLSGLVLSFTSLGGMISTYFINRWLENSYKQPMYMSVIFIIFGSIFYIIASPTKYIILACIGRFLLGIGNGRLINRNYILLFVPKNKMSKYLLYFQICTLFGIAIGPLLNIFFIFITDLFGDNSLFNMFINPVWFILILAIVLLINIHFFYTEPIQTEFTILRNANFETDQDRKTITRDSMSEIERNMIDQIDSKLGEINQQNRFSDTNLVSRNIEQIAWKENKTNSYLYKSFLLFIAILFVVRMTNEIILVMSPFYLYKYDNLDVKLIALFLSISLFIAIPSTIVLTNYLSNRLRDRKIVVIILLFCILTNILVINFLNMHIFLYMTILGFLIILSNLLENIASSIFSKIIPSNYEIWNFNAGIIINYITMIARLFGSLILIVFSSIEYSTINIIAYTLTSSLFLIIFVMTILFYSDVRVKAIARILRARSIRKHKSGEF